MHFKNVRAFAFKDAKNKVSFSFKRVDVNAGFLSSERVHVDPQRCGAFPLK